MRTEPWTPPAFSMLWLDTPSPREMNRPYVPHTGDSSPVICGFPAFHLGRSVSRRLSVPHELCDAVEHTRFDLPAVRALDQAQSRLEG